MSSKARFLLKVTTSFSPFYLQMPACAAMKQRLWIKGVAGVFLNHRLYQPLKVKAGGKSSRPVRPPSKNLV